MVQKIACRAGAPVTWDTFSHCPSHFPPPPHHDERSAPCHTHSSTQEPQALLSSLPTIKLAHRFEEMIPGLDRIMLRIQRMKSVGCMPRSTWGRALATTTTSAQSGNDAHSATIAPESDADRLPVKLYQYSICPFCHRAKALLAYSKTPYEVVEVNPLTRQEIRW